MNNRMADHARLNAVAQQGPASADCESWVLWVTTGICMVLLVAVGVIVLGMISRQHRKESLARLMTAVSSIPGRKRDLAASSEWWTRTQWALEATVSENEVMNVYGLKMLRALTKSEGADLEEKAMLDAVWRGSFTRMEDDAIDQLIREARELEILLEAPRPSPLNGDEEDRPESAPKSDWTPRNRYDTEKREEVRSVLRRETLTARLKIDLDQQLGRETSLKVKLLSEVELPLRGR